MTCQWRLHEYVEWTWKIVSTFDEYLETYLEDDIEVRIVSSHLTEHTRLLRKVPHPQDARKHVCPSEEEDKRVEDRGSKRTARLR
jgi:hypothetical protein